MTADADSDHDPEARRGADLRAELIADLWAHRAVPSLRDYIRIPNQSPAFDPDWSSNGQLDRAAEHVAAWCAAEAPPGLSVEIVRLPGRTPVVVMELSGPGKGTALLYGHLDKQPPMLPWADGLDPYEPVTRDGRLYGRGGADDGYSAYAAVLALRVLRELERPHGRCVVLIEASEESGSPDLPAYLEHLGDRIGTPDLVVCLDSGAGDYEQLWATTSLRGLVGGTLTIEVLTEGVHSGDAGGIVPDSFRIARIVLDRIENVLTGQVDLPSTHVLIPPGRRRQAGEAAARLGPSVTRRFPFVGQATAIETDPTEAILNRTWRPALTVHGAAGLPPIDRAGAVLRPDTTLKLSVRIPPGTDPDEVARELRDRLEADPPHRARVTFDVGLRAPGWNAPPLAPWLATSIEHASRAHFDQPPLFMGEGGTIPFMATLSRRFPLAQFLVTGVLGPQSNAHGPNEFLHLDYTRRLIACVADVLEAQADRGSQGSGDEGPYSP